MDEMNEIEQSLRASLRHVPAPDGFTERVMARAGMDSTRPIAATVGRRTRRVPPRLQPTSAWWAAAAAALLLVVGTGDALHLRHQRERAAEAQVDLALQLTSRALDQVELNVDRSHAGRFTHLGNEFLQ